MTVIDFPQASPLRWQASIAYRTANGPVYKMASFEELSELEDIIERGPHWDSIIRVIVTLNRAAQDRNLTVEEAEQL